MSIVPDKSWEQCSYCVRVIFKATFNCMRHPLNGSLSGILKVPLTEMWKRIQVLSTPGETRQPQVLQAQLRGLNWSTRSHIRLSVYCSPMTTPSETRQNHWRITPVRTWWLSMVGQVVDDELCRGTCRPPGGPSLRRAREDKGKMKRQT